MRIFDSESDSESDNDLKININPRHCSCQKDHSLITSRYHKCLKTFDDVIKACPYPPVYPDLKLLERAKEYYNFLINFKNT